MMTRKTYKEIALTIKATTRTDNKAVINKDELIKSLCDFFGKDNPNFKPVRFAEVCEI